MKTEEQSIAQKLQWTEKSSRLVSLNTENKDFLLPG